MTKREHSKGDGDRLPVAAMILEQLGGRRFLAMTGAKNLVGSEDSLMFQLPASLVKDRGNKLTITLSPMDTYTLTLYRIRGTDAEVVATEEDVYAEDLQAAFTRVTGLDTQL